MPDPSTCESVLRFGDGTLHCELPADHITPSEELPQGTPHASNELSDLWRWWG